MSVELTAALCSDVAAALGLPHPGLVEKDFHVVRALRALGAVESKGASLVFGGGTSLCRAFRLIERMSEDIDLRIVSREALSQGERKAFRGKVTECLVAAGFASADEHLQVHDGGKTFVYHLPYQPVSAAVESLRPGVKIEISSWPLLQAPVLCSVASFVSQAREVAAEVPEIRCVAVVETAADKFVALTRRIAEERATNGSRDPSLLRHVYDLQRIRAHVDLDAIRPLIHQIMQSDRETRGRKFPAYAADPGSVSIDAIHALGQDQAYAEAFQVFQRDMVYGEHQTLQDCLPGLEELAALLVKRHE